MKADAALPGLSIWHPAGLIGTWFGAGLLPVAPGTWGSLAALPFAWIIHATTGPMGLGLAALAAFALGCWASQIIVDRGGIRDPSAVVIDEVAAQWLTLTMAPLDPLAYGLGFLLFRAADILKPWPAGWIDRNMHGGLGIMLDDVAAAVYAALGLMLILPLLG